MVDCCPALVLTAIIIFRRVLVWEWLLLEQDRERLFIREIVLEVRFLMVVIGRVGTSRLMGTVVVVVLERDRMGNMDEDHPTYQCLEGTLGMVVQGRSCIPMPEDTITGHHRLLIIFMHIVPSLHGEECREPPRQALLPTVARIIRITIHCTVRRMIRTMVIRHRAVVHLTMAVDIRMGPPRLPCQRTIIIRRMGHHLIMDVLHRLQEWVGGTMISVVRLLLCLITMSFSLRGMNMGCITPTSPLQRCILFRAMPADRLDGPILMIQV